MRLVGKTGVEPSQDRDAIARALAADLLSAQLREDGLDRLGAGEVRRAARRERRQRRQRAVERAHRAGAFERERAVEAVADESAHGLPDRTRPLVRRARALECLHEGKHRGGRGPHAADEPLVPHQRLVPARCDRLRAVLGERGVGARASLREAERARDIRMPDERRERLHRTLADERREPREERAEARRGEGARLAARCGAAGELERALDRAGGLVVGGHDGDLVAPARRGERPDRGDRTLSALGRTLRDLDRAAPHARRGKTARFPGLRARKALGIEVLARVHADLDAHAARGERREQFALDRLGIREEDDDPVEATRRDAPVADRVAHCGVPVGDAGRIEHRIPARGQRRERSEPRTQLG